MVDGDHVDPIVADDVEDSVGKGAKRRTADARCDFGIDLRMALDTGETGFH
jgi:hypothetical protein